MREGKAVWARVGAVRDRIEYWRGIRQRHSPMPEPLWAAAAALAAEHGTYPIARALRLNYGTLKSRVGRIPHGERAEAARAVGFVEVDRGELIGSAEAAGRVVELSGTDGAKLVIRLNGGDELDVLGLAEAFWRRT